MPEPKPPEAPPSEDSFAAGLGRAIRVLRTGRDLGRRDLAERAGLSYSYLAEIEKGAKSPSSRALAAIAEGLGVAAHVLVEAAEAWRTPLSDEEIPGPRPGTRSSDRATSLAEATEYIFDEEQLEADIQASIGSRPRARRGVWQARAEQPIRARMERRAASAPAGLFNQVFQLRGRARRAEPGRDVPAALVEEIRAGSCVAFVGAGFSAAVIPEWGAVLERVATRGDASKATRRHVAERAALGSASALDEAAQVLEDELGRERFLAELEVLLGHPLETPAMARRVRWLHGIPFRTILTTSFDGILAGETPSLEVYRHALRPEAHSCWSPDYWGGGKGAFTLKLHGDVTRPEPADDTVVLTRRDYRRRLYDDPAYETFLRSVMATTTVLYLGFSFEDAYLNELRSAILALLGDRSGEAPVAYAIVNDVPAKTREHFRQHEGIEILSYDTRDGSDFSGFDRYLEAIHAATNPLLHFARHLEHRRILWVGPQPENEGPAFERLAEAARIAGRAGTALVAVATADEGLDALAAAAPEAPFDLAISHWGEGAARDDSGNPIPTAVRLLTGIRARDLRCPVVLFAAAEDVEQRKRTALGLGAQAYCASFESLYRTLERVLAPGDETG